MPVLAKIAPRDGLAVILDSRGSTECVYDANGISVPYPSSSAIELHDFESAIVSVRDAQEAVSILKQKADMSMCLDMVLMLFDDDISHQTKKKLAIALQELLSETKVKQYAQDILFAKPLPSAANLDAAAAATAEIEPTSSFIREVIDAQPHVQRIFDSWLMVDKNALLDQSGADRVFAILSLNGVFRRLALEVTTRAELSSIKGELIFAAGSNRRQRIYPIDMQAFLDEFEKLLPVVGGLQIEFDHSPSESKLVALAAEPRMFIPRIVPQPVTTISVVAVAVQRLLRRVFQRVLVHSSSRRVRTRRLSVLPSSLHESMEYRMLLANNLDLSSEGIIRSDMISLNYIANSEPGLVAQLDFYFQIDRNFAEFCDKIIFKSGAIRNCGIVIDFGTTASCVIEFQSAQQDTIALENASTVSLSSVNDVRQTLDLLCLWTRVNVTQLRATVLEAFIAIDPSAWHMTGYSGSSNIVSPTNIHSVLNREFKTKGSGNTLISRQLVARAELFVGIDHTLNAEWHTNNDIIIGNVQNDSMTLRADLVLDSKQAPPIPSVPDAHRTGKSVSELKLLTVFLQIEKTAIAYLISDLENRLCEIEIELLPSYSSLRDHRRAIDQAVLCFERLMEPLPIADEAYSICRTVHTLIDEFYRNLSDSFPYIDSAPIGGVRESEHVLTTHFKAAANHIRWLILELKPLVSKISAASDETCYALKKCESGGGDVAASIQKLSRIV